MFLIQSSLKFIVYFWMVNSKKESVEPTLCNEKNYIDDSSYQNNVSIIIHLIEDRCEQSTQYDTQLCNF